VSEDAVHPPFNRADPKQRTGFHATAGANRRKPLGGLLKRRVALKFAPMQFRTES